MALNEENLQFPKQPMEQCSGEDSIDKEKIKLDSIIKQTEGTNQLTDVNIPAEGLNKDNMNKDKRLFELEWTNTKLEADNTKLENQIIQQTNKNTELSNELNSMREQYDKLMIEYKEVKEKNTQLNYNSIELQQKISSSVTPMQSQGSYETNIYKLKESFLEKEQTYEIEVSRLTNHIEELEILKSKLQFENKTLKFKLSDTEDDKASELALLQSMKDNEINNHKQTIKSLNHQITLLTKRLSNTSNETAMNQMTTNNYIEQLNELEGRIKDLNNENYKLKSENQSHLNYITDCEIRIENKDKIIDKLQNDFEKLINEYKGKIKEFNDDVNQALSSDVLLNQLDNLTQEKEELFMKNQQLENGLTELNNSIKNANVLFNTKYAEFEYDLEQERNKNKEYKKRISNLKLKIDQLYEENSIKKGEINKPEYHHGHKKSMDYLNTEPISRHMPNVQNMNHNRLTMMTMSPNKNIMQTIGSGSNIHNPNNNNNEKGTKIYHDNNPNLYYFNQQRTLDNYRRTLEKVDVNLKKKV